MLFTVQDPLSYALPALSQETQASLFFTLITESQRGQTIYLTTIPLLKRQGWYANPSLLSTNQGTKHFGRELGQSDRGKHTQQGADYLSPKRETFWVNHSAQNSNRKQKQRRVSKGQKFERRLPGGWRLALTRRSERLNLEGSPSNWPRHEGSSTGSTRSHPDPSAGQTESGDARGFILPRTALKRPRKLRVNLLSVPSLASRDPLAGEGKGNGYLDSCSQRARHLPQSGSRESTLHAPVGHSGKCSLRKKLRVLLEERNPTFVLLHLVAAVYLQLYPRHLKNAKSLPHAHILRE